MSIFSEPEAHNVIGISARTKVCPGDRTAPFVILTLNLKARYGWENEARTGDFRVYADADMADKFARLAVAINEIFAPEWGQIAAGAHVSEDA